MKKLFTITSLVLLASAAQASDLNLPNSHDLYDGVAVGHGSSEQVSAVQRGIGDNYASQLIRQPADHSDGASKFDFSHNDPDGNQDILSL